MRRVLPVVQAFAARTCCPADLAGKSRRARREIAPFFSDGVRPSWERRGARVELRTSKMTTNKQENLKNTEQLLSQEMKT